MGILDSIFGNKNSPWNELLANENVEEEMIFVVKKFYIPDEIIIEKFLKNSVVFEELANQPLYVIEFSEVDCTPSMKFAVNSSNRGPGIPDWFIIAYPDVIKWMFHNTAYTRTLYHPPYITGEGHDLQAKPEFFRALIQRFLYEGNKLECAQ